MVEWDEIDWRSAIGVVVFGILLIAGAVFVVNDYITAKGMKEELENQITRIDDFYSTWKPPSRKGLEEMKAKADSLQQELDKLSPKIGLEIDLNKLQGRIQQLANSVGVSVEMTAKPERTEEFLKIYPITLLVKGTNEQMSRFLTGIENLGMISRRLGVPSISLGQLEITIEFLSFDQEAWNTSYSCSVQAKPPELSETDIGRVKIFKGNLAELKAKVDSERGKLAEAQKLLAERCELEKQSSGLERQIKLSKELAH